MVVNSKNNKKLYKVRNKGDWLKERDFLNALDNLEEVYLSDALKENCDSKEFIEKVLAIKKIKAFSFSQIEWILFHWFFSNVNDDIRILSEYSSFK